MSFLEFGSRLVADLCSLRTMTNLKINFIGINMLSLPLVWLWALSARKPIPLLPILIGIPGLPPAYPNPQISFAKSISNQPVGYIKAWSSSNFYNSRMWPLRSQKPHEPAITFQQFFWPTRGCGLIYFACFLKGAHDALGSLFRNTEFICDFSLGFPLCMLFDYLNLFCGVQMPQLWLFMSWHVRLLILFKVEVVGFVFRYRVCQASWPTIFFTQRFDFYYPSHTILILKQAIDHWWSSLSIQLVLCQANLKLPSEKESVISLVKR